MLLTKFSFRPCITTFVLIHQEEEAKWLCLHSRKALLLLCMFLPIIATYSIALEYVEKSPGGCWTPKENTDPFEMIKPTEVLM